jgi:5-methylcytosine-specific restriction endonuclease McrA
MQKDYINLLDYYYLDGRPRRRRGAASKNAKRINKQAGDKTRSLSIAYAHGEVSTRDSKQSRRIASNQLSVEYTQYINSIQWLAKRAQILKQRGNKCEECGTTQAIQVHHLHYRTFRHERPQDMKVLCKTCHELWHRMKKCAR